VSEVPARGPGSLALGILALVGLFLLGGILQSILSSKPETPVKQVSELAHQAGAIGKAVPVETSREIIIRLRKRLTEAQLKDIARRSVEIEETARAKLGESEAGYERMAIGWARLCTEWGLNEAERDAIEDQAIRQGW